MFSFIFSFFLSYQFLVSLFTLICFLLLLIILIQPNKERTGLGSLGGGSQMIFGGTGGQDLLQKITWGLGAIFIVGSLALSILKTKSHKASSYFAHPNQNTHTSLKK